MTFVTALNAAYTLLLPLAAARAAGQVTARAATLITARAAAHITALTAAPRRQLRRHLPGHLPRQFPVRTTPR